MEGSKDCGWLESPDMSISFCLRFFSLALFVVSYPLDFSSIISFRSLLDLRMITGFTSIIFEKGAVAAPT